MLNTKEPTTNYNNIPNGIVVKETVTNTIRATVEEVQKATIVLSIFHAIQLAKGCKEYINGIDEKEIVVPKQVISIYVKLTDAIIDGKQEISEQFQRYELFTLLNFLEARMKHCEIERDNKSNKFNPDSYIGQKLLLIDLKQLLLGRVIEY